MQIPAHTQTTNNEQRERRKNEKNNRAAWQAIYDERRIGDYIAAKEIANREKMEFELDGNSAEHETSHAARRMPSCCFLSSFSRGPMYTVKIAAIFALKKKKNGCFSDVFRQNHKNSGRF